MCSGRLSGQHADTSDWDEKGERDPYHCDRVVDPRRFVKRVGRVKKRHFAPRTMPLLANSDDFVFDKQVLAQVVALGYSIGEISVPTKYFPEASSIGFGRSVRYGLGVVATSVEYRAWRMGLRASARYSPSLELPCGMRSQTRLFVRGRSSDLHRAR